MQPFEILAWAKTTGCVVCLDCQPDEREGDYPVFADSEWDIAPSCDICHELIEGARVIGNPCETCYLDCNFAECEAVGEVKDELG